MCLGFFFKKPIHILLSGITADNKDVSIDIIKNVNVELLKNIMKDSYISLKILKRGSPPDGGGEVEFTCNPLDAIPPINLNDIGKVIKIRGLR